MSAPRESEVLERTADARKIKVLMVGPARNVKGGISTVVNGCYASGLDCVVDLDYIGTMEDGGKLKKLWVALKAYVRFCRCVRRYDIVHVQMAAQASFFRKSYFVRRARHAGKKIIIHSHAADFDAFFHEQSNARQKKKILEIFGMADRVLALSKEWANFFGSNILSPQKVSVLKNAVEQPEHVKTSYDDHNVLFLGRLGHRKGTYDLLKAVPRVLQAVPDACFYFGGDGEIDRCKALAAEEGVLDHVRFLGWAGDAEKERCMSACSLFALPSYHEGMPMAILEAMGHGLAVVTTNAGGIPDLVEDGVDGIMLEPGDVGQLSDALIGLLQDADRKKRLGQAAAVKVASHFSMEGYIRGLLDIYQELEGPDNDRNQVVSARA